MRRLVMSALAVPILFAAACGGSDTKPPGGGGGPGREAAKDPGALIDASMTSQVGVLLDEVPMSMRDRVADALIAKPDDFWKARAVTQIKLTAYRLVFRVDFYDDPKDALPLPLDKQW